MAGRDVQCCLADLVRECDRKDFIVCLDDPPETDNHVWMRLHGEHLPEATERVEGVDASVCTDVEEIAARVGQDREEAELGFPVVKFPVDQLTSVQAMHWKCVGGLAEAFQKVHRFSSPLPAIAKHRCARGRGIPPGA